MNNGWQTLYRVTKVVAPLLVAAAFAFVALVYPDLPGRVPVHWNFAGEVDDYAGKPWGPFLVPLAGLFLYALLLALNARVPEAVKPRVWAVVTAIIAFVTYVTQVLTLVWTGADLRLGRFVVGGVGVILIVIGQVIRGLPRNRWIGLRTPSTLAHEAVWKAAHEEGSVVFRVLGFLVILSAALGIEPAAVPLILLAVIALLIRVRILAGRHRKNAA